MTSSGAKITYSKTKDALNRNHRRHPARISRWAGRSQTPPKRRKCFRISPAPAGADTVRQGTVDQR